MWVKSTRSNILQLTAFRIYLLVVYGNFVCHLSNQIIGLFSLSPVIWRLVHLHMMRKQVHILVSNYSKLFSSSFKIDLITLNCL